MSSVGQNIVFVNRADKIAWTPGSWSNALENTKWTPYTRVGGTYHLEEVAQSVDSDVLINPTWTSTITSNRRDYVLYIKLDQAQTGVYFLCYTEDDTPIFESTPTDMEAGEVTIDLRAGANGPGFLDLNGGIDYKFSLLSEDGDVRVLGSSSLGLPYVKLTWQEWADVAQATVDDIPTAEELFINPSFVAIDSSNPDVTYGGFSTTGRIRKRVISTNTDTFFQSSVTTPVTDASTWTDWQNRESLTYAS
ncbi:hypothetical protein GR7B_00186 [Vibrio phage vB_VcorM_GR7B]|nr:hypothetical protein GR7B_00186 [Vibrio phage vB_VcorM_GR7B]